MSRITTSYCTLHQSIHISTFKPRHQGNTVDSCKVNIISLQEEIEQRTDPEELDGLELQEEQIEVYQVTVGLPSLQGLLSVIKTAELEEAFILIELAVTTLNKCSL